MNEVTTTPKKSVIMDMATRFGMEPVAFEQVLRATVMPSDKEVSREQFAAFLLVAKEYSLNPLTKEIYAFPGKGGSIQPIVSIDGWMRMINNHPNFDGMEFEDNLSETGAIVSITCKMFRKDRSHPVSVTEYMSECKRQTDTWSKWPARMLRHKSAIQAARYAFGFSGIYDEDEAARIVDVTPVQQVAVERPVVPAGASSRVASILGAQAVPVDAVVVTQEPMTVEAAQ
ncbi:bet_lambda, phage recombination protein Bet [uncultured Caudovirales phage]|uniref:Bet_lambda, phage recombination protein Bet n=1 Tax=uncultured Caudovirales phage TaxID=2100421 RepID=A0A6J5LPD1_9CAUD|nr:bet_lambda, phage recombination protein Bet [uncultured Caudovirales phage]